MDSPQQRNGSICLAAPGWLSPQPSPEGSAASCWGAAHSRPCLAGLRLPVDDRSTTLTLGTLFARTPRSCTTASAGLGRASTAGGARRDAVALAGDHGLARAIRGRRLRNRGLASWSTTRGIRASATSSSSMHPAITIFNDPATAPIQRPLRYAVADQIRPRRLVLRDRCHGPGLQLNVDNDDGCA